MPTLKKSKEIKIIRQTPNDIAVFKPKGIATELSDDKKCASLVSKVKEMLNLSEKPKLPHRLDRITEGIVLLTFNDEALRYYNNEIQEGLWEKYYIAKVILNNNINPENLKKIHKAYLKEKDGRSFVVKSGGKSSFLEILDIKQNDSKTLFFVIKLLTGRFHQIRVMLADLGFPLAGDFLYSQDKSFSEDDFYLEHFLLKYRDFSTKEIVSLYFQDFSKSDNLSLIKSEILSHLL